MVGTCALCGEPPARPAVNHRAQQWKDAEAPFLAPSELEPVSLALQAGRDLHHLTHSYRTVRKENHSPLSISHSLFTIRNALPPLQPIEQAQFRAGDLFQIKIRSEHRAEMPFELGNRRRVGPDEVELFDAVVAEAR